VLAAAGRGLVVVTAGRAEAQVTYTFGTINVPGASFVIASGINNSGQIVGGYDDASGYAHGFLDTGGFFTTINVPGASTTYAYGINDSGQIVGGYDDAYGFLATPSPNPRPSP
jgi:probable HAF family extracellular repeat protein